MISEESVLVIGDALFCYIFIFRETIKVSESENIFKLIRGTSVVPQPVSWFFGDSRKKMSPD